MFVLIEQESGGIYAVQSKDKKKTVTVFESEDDACLLYTSDAADE